MSDDTRFAARDSFRPFRVTNLTTDARRPSAPPPSGHRPTSAGPCNRAVYTGGVVIFFEVLLVLASILIAWFSLYVVYRLVTDES